MKVYAVCQTYDNGEMYEDSYVDDSVICVASTREKAIEYIKALDIPEGFEEAEPMYDSIIRTFKGIEENYCGNYEWYEYKIQEFDLVE